ncbi:NAD+ synthase [Candidatus Woesearchaeota archaeon]|nr:NAD+ synthase [Candidatus Woesearchaeota archaeon]
MNKYPRIAIAQINPIVGDLTGNATKIIQYIERAKAEGAKVVIFPEQVVTGYPAQDLLLHEDFIRDTMYVTEQIVKNTQGITAIIGTVRATARGPGGKSAYNTAIVAKDGEIIAEQQKTLLPTYDVFHELRYFTPAKKVKPIEIDGIKYGIQLCEDMWDEDYDRKITKELANQGAELMINLSASPYYVHKKKVRTKIVQSHAKNNELPFLYINMVGAQDELIFDGGSIVANADGTLAYQLPQFRECLQIIELDKKPITELEIKIKEEEIFEALKLGVRDYFQKNGLRKAVLGLSGGIDSTLTAVIAKEALGAENVIGIAMPSKFSTDHSITDAEALAKNLGIRLDYVPIKEMYDSAVKAMQASFEGKSFDVTEENIQARLRMMILMAYTNKHGYTLLSTSDKSETAIGYTTLYGDMSGALSVISDLTKPEAYKVARWYNEKNGEIIPEHILTKPPSPELKPGQVAPFDYERLSPIMELITNRVPLRKIHALGYKWDEIRIVYQKWKNAEFKRFQSPIALKCKPTSFGKGRIYPVTNRYIPSALFENDEEKIECEETVCVLK